MKKVFMLLLLILFIYIGYLIVNRNKELDYGMLAYTEDISANVDNYYIYGNHLNIKGNLDVSNIDFDLENVSLILKNKSDEFKLNVNFELQDNLLVFNSSDLINEGIDLDSLPRGNWYLFIKINIDDIDKYYNLINKTTYENIEYYTISKNKSNNKIEVLFENTIIDEKNIDYVNIKVTKEDLPDDVYDIVIDPGHGGVDSGAFKKLDDVLYTESDITLEIAQKLKKNLEKQGYKVLLTRESDIDLDFYGENGRAVIPNKNHAKLCLSLHLNSDSSTMKYGGVEVYVPNDTNNVLATSLATNIATNTKVGYSKKIDNKIEDGVYFNSFNASDIKEANENYAKKNMKPYDIKVGAPEMYMIREVGGKATHAYVDGRNEKVGLNPYYNSNQTAEGYLIELAYISYESDLKEVVNNSNSFVSAISKSIIDYYK